MLALVEKAKADFALHCLELDTYGMLKEESLWPGILDHSGCADAA